MIHEIRYGLANLRNFKGRDPRKVFWPFAIAVWLTVALIAAVIDIYFVPSILNDMSTVAGSQWALVALAPFLIGAVVVMMLLAAAMTRRVRDGGANVSWLLWLLIAYLGYLVPLIAIALIAPDLEGLPSLIVLIGFALILASAIATCLLAFWVLYLLLKPSLPASDQS